MELPVLSSVRIQVKDAVGSIELNRPDTLNAFDAEMIEDITAATIWFNQQPEIKVVIIKSRARAFSSGFHLEQFLSMDPSLSAEIVEKGHQMIEAVANMVAITIAVVNGHCVGGGIVLTAACDFRFSSGDANFFLPETDLGIPLIWGGIPRLLRELGPIATYELVLLGKHIDANEAKSVGLINQFYSREDLEKSTDAVAERLCRKSSLVLQTTKRQIAVGMNCISSTQHSFLEQYSMLAALLDKESIESRSHYMEEKSLNRKVEAKARS